MSQFSCGRVAPHPVARGVLAVVVDRHQKLAGAGLHDQRLIGHPADQVERRRRLAVQGQFLEVVLKAGFHDLAQFLADLEETVRGTQAVDPLMGAAMVVPADPQRDPFPGRLEALQRRPVEELALEVLPETLDLAQSHGVMRAGADVVDTGLAQFLLEAGLAAPGRELAAVVGQHLPGLTVLGDCPAVHFHHVLGTLAAVQFQADEEPGVVVDKPDQVGVVTGQAEDVNIGLPHLIRGGAFEAARLSGRPRQLHGCGVDQPVPVERLAHRLRAGRQQEEPPQHLGEARGPEPRVLLLQGDNLVLDRLRQLGRALPGLALKSRLPEFAVHLGPAVHGLLRNSKDPGQLIRRQALLDAGLGNLQPLLGRVRGPAFGAVHQAGLPTFAGLPGGILLTHGAPPGRAAETRRAGTTPQ